VSVGGTPSKPVKPKEPYADHNTKVEARLAAAQRAMMAEAARRGQCRGLNSQQQGIGSGGLGNWDAGPQSQEAALRELELQAIRCRQNTSLFGKLSGLGDLGFRPDDLPAEQPKIKHDYPRVPDWWVCTDGRHHKPMWNCDHPPLPDSFSRAVNGKPCQGWHQLFIENHPRVIPFIVLGIFFLVLTWCSYRD